MSSSTTFEYKGYLGSAEVDVEGSVLVGQLLFIRDVIAYSADDPASLRRAFEEAVDDYLQSCAEEGDGPDRPCKGSFNVRVSPELHRKAAVEARRSGQSLNDFVACALAASLNEPARSVQHVHLHRVSVRVDGGTPEPVHYAASGVPAKAVQGGRTH